MALIDRDIAVLRRYSEIEQEIEKTPKSKAEKPKVSRKEKSQQRSEDICAILKEAGGEIHSDKIAKRLGMHPITLKDWMLSRIKKQGEKCLWEIGRNNSYFRLKNATLLFS